METGLLARFRIRAIEPRGGNIVRRYETIFIIHADLSSDEMTALVDRYAAIVTSFKGTIVKIDNWGKRRLAYHIEKRREGVYYLFDYVSGNEAVSELERNFKIDEKVMRYQTVKLSDKVDMDEIEKEIAAAQKKELPPETPPSEEVTVEPEIPQDETPQEQEAAEESETVESSEETTEEKKEEE